MRMGRGVQSNPNVNDIPIRNPATDGQSPAIGVVERQLVELITGKSVKIVPKGAVHRHPGETVTVSIGIDSGTYRQVAGIELALVPRTSPVAAKVKLCKRWFARISQIHGGAPHAGQRALRRQTREVRLRSGKQSGPGGLEALIGRRQHRLGKLVTQPELAGHADSGVLHRSFDEAGACVVGIVDHCKQTPAYR